MKVIIKDIPQNVSIQSLEIDLNIETNNVSVTSIETSPMLSIDKHHNSKDVDVPDISNRDPIEIPPEMQELF